MVVSTKAAPDVDRGVTDLAAAGLDAGVDAGMDAFRFRSASSRICNGTPWKQVSRGE